jgi:hypothetical protein
MHRSRSFWHGVPDRPNDSRGQQVENPRKTEAKGFFGP